MKMSYVSKKLHCTHHQPTHLNLRIRGSTALVFLTRTSELILGLGLFLLSCGADLEAPAARIRAAVHNMNHFLRVPIGPVPIGADVRWEQAGNDRHLVGLYLLTHVEHDRHFVRRAGFSWSIRLRREQVLQEGDLAGFPLGTEKQQRW